MIGCILLTLDRVRGRLVRAPREVAAIAAMALGLFLAMAVLVHDRSDNRVDAKVEHAVVRLVPARLVSWGLWLTTPWLVVTLIVVVMALAVLARRLDVALLAALVPTISVLLVEHMLKPLVHRTDGSALAFPSGHETGVASIACVLALVTVSSRISLRNKVFALVLLTADVALAAVGLVGNDYHYASDTVGSLVLCIVITVAIAFAVDAVGRRRTASRDTRTRKLSGVVTPR